MSTNAVKPLFHSSSECHNYRKDPEGIGVPGCSWSGQLRVALAVCPPLFGKVRGSKKGGSIEPPVGSLSVFVTFSVA